MISMSPTFRAALGGLAGSGLVYGVTARWFAGGQVDEFLYNRGPVQPVIVLVGVVGLILWLQSRRGARREAKALTAFEAAPYPARKVSAVSARDLLACPTSAPPVTHTTSVVNAMLTEVENGCPAREAATAGAAGSGDMGAAPLLDRTIQMLPVLGLFGTILGTLVAMRHLGVTFTQAGDFEVLRDGLTNFASGMLAALATTALGVGLMVLLQGLQALGRGREEGNRERLQALLRRLAGRIENGATPIEDAVRSDLHEIREDAIETVREGAAKISEVSLTLLSEHIAEIARRVLDQRLEGDNGIVARIDAINQTSIDRMETMNQAFADRVVQEMGRPRAMSLHVVASEDAEEEKIYA